MLCKKCGEELSPNPTSRYCDTCRGTGGSRFLLLDFLCSYVRTAFVISFWVNIVGCLVGGYLTYKFIDGSTMFAFFVAVLVIVASGLLTMLFYGLIAVFLNIEKGITDLNGKINVKMVNSLNAINADINKKDIFESSK